MQCRKAAPDVSWLPIDINFLKQLWLPNVYVYDLVSFNPLECLEKLAGLWVVEKKEIFYNLVRKRVVRVRVRLGNISVWILF